MSGKQKRKPKAWQHKPKQWQRKLQAKLQSFSHRLEKSPLGYSFKQLDQWLTSPKVRTAQQRFLVRFIFLAVATCFATIVFYSASNILYGYLKPNQSCVRFLPPMVGELAGVEQCATALQQPKQNPGQSQPGLKTPQATPKTTKPETAKPDAAKPENAETDSPKPESEPSPSPQ